MKSEAQKYLTENIYDSDVDVNIYNEGNLEISKKIHFEGSIHTCKFDPTGELFSIGFSDGSIKIFKKNNCQLMYTLIDNDVKLKRLPVTCIQFYNPKNQEHQDHYKVLVASYICGYIKYWHYPSMQCIYTIREEEMKPLVLNINKCFDRIAVGGYHQDIKIYDLKTKKLISSLEYRGGITLSSSNRIYSIKYHPNEVNQLISGGWDDRVHVWDDRTNISQNFIYGPHICGDSLDIDQENAHLLTGSWRKNSTLQIWDLRKFGLIRDIFKNKADMMPYGSIKDAKYPISSIDNDHNEHAVNLIAACEKIVYLMKIQS